MESEQATLMAQLAEWEYRYEHREPRPQDIEAIQRLESDLGRSRAQVCPGVPGVCVRVRVCVFGVFFFLVGYQWISCCGRYLVCTRGRPSIVPPFPRSVVVLTPNSSPVCLTRAPTVARGGGGRHEVLQARVGEP